MTDQVATAPPMGWYPDPQAPQQERWWSGAEWSEHTWRASWLERHLPRIPTPPVYQRSMRIGANAVLRPALVLQAVVVVLLFVSPFAWYLMGAGDAGRQAYIVAVGIQVGTIAAAITLGVIGAILSRRLGGFAAAIWSLAFSALLVGLIVFASSVMFTALRTLG